jgi:hypothetical protein
MGKWNHTVSIDLDAILEDESTSVEQKGCMIAERLSTEVCFRSFPHLGELRSAQHAVALDQGLARMYDYADLHRIWVM